jgi:hypothetical protein
MLPILGSLPFLESTVSSAKVKVGWFCNVLKLGILFNALILTSFDAMPPLSNIAFFIDEFVIESD